MNELTDVPLTDCGAATPPYLVWDPRSKSLSSSLTSNSLVVSSVRGVVGVAGVFTPVTPRELDIGPRKDGVAEVNDEDVNTAGR